MKRTSEKKEYIKEMAPVFQEHIQSNKERAWGHSQSKFLYEQLQGRGSFPQPLVIEGNKYLFSCVVIGTEGRVMVISDHVGTCLTWTTKWTSGALRNVEEISISLLAKTLKSLIG